MEVRTGPTKWAAVLLTGVFGVTLASVLWLADPGLFRLGGEADVEKTATATVVTGLECGGAGQGETVTFADGGREIRAQLDACGHSEGETVEVAVPTEGDQGLVHAASAAPGSEGPGRRLSLPLLVLSTFAGAGYAVLVKRGPRRAVPTAAAPVTGVPAG
jgi:hypothetical protein